MAFVTGLVFIDAPAAALNNAGIDKSKQDQNTVATKFIQVGRDRYPYVSAQAYRYWLREGLPLAAPQWRNSPIYRESENIAYTAADPIQYWDDDLFGYMRAPKASSLKTREADPAYIALTPVEIRKKDNKQVEVTLTRSSPFRVGTLVSIAPAILVENQESMSRHDGDPVLYISQFYRATLKGLFSLNLHQSGTFSYREKTGFRHLDQVRIDRVKGIEGVQHLEAEKAYRLPLAERIRRVSALFEGMARLEGGAKQTLHYTDVSPVIVLLAVTKGGNHIFNHVIGADNRGMPKLNRDALSDILRVYADEIISPIYVGWVKGYLDAERAEFEAFAQSHHERTPQQRILISHPREAFLAMAQAFAQNSHWLA